MSSRAILITGACGLVGAPLTKLLTERGDRVVGLDPAEVAGGTERFHAYSGRIRRLRHAGRPAAGSRCR